MRLIINYLFHHVNKMSYYFQPYKSALLDTLGIPNSLGSISICIFSPLLGTVGEPVSLPPPTPGQKRPHKAGGLRGDCK